MFAPARAPDDALRAVLATLVPSLFAPVLVPAPLLDLGVPEAAVAAVGGVLLLGSLLRPGVLSRWLVTTGITTVLCGWIASHPARPGLALVLAVAAGSLLTAVWPDHRGETPLRGLPPVPASAAVAVGLAWLGWGASLRGPGGDLAIAGSALVAGLVAWSRSTGRLERQLATVALMWPLAYVALREGHLIGQGAVPLLAVVPLALVARGVPPARVLAPIGRLLVELVVENPPRLLVSGFAGVCLLGSVFLALPVADRAGRGFDLVDAVFTSISAVCVTGLTVVPADRLSGFGEVVVAVLVQVGGLGILSFATLAMHRGGVRMAEGRQSVSAMVGPGMRADLALALRRVLVVTFVSEAVGAALLLPALVSEGHGVSSLWHAVFLAVSANCNAGFVPGSKLDVFVHAPWVLLVLSGLVVVGGMGPAFVTAVPDLVAGRKVPLAVRLSLVTTVALLVIPLLFLLGLEWRGVLEGLPFLERLANAWMLTVSPRSAGFTAVDLTNLEPATWSLFVFLMLVGGNAGSTAGGMKVTTLAVLVLAALAAIRGRRNAEFGWRQIPHRVVYEAVAVTLGMMGTVAIGLVLLQLTQRMPLDVALFEVASAVGTVGLSIGGTDQVDSLGKIVLAACMFAGRVGPLTLFLLLSEDRQEGGSAWPIEEVPVG